jgi:CRISPR type I-E-associated protein CasB/Cse2
MNPTEEYVSRLARLKTGELELLRAHAGRGLDETVEGFDLFAGLWWPLRARSQRAPRRTVAWLIARLYGFRPIEHSAGQTLALQLARCREDEDLQKDPVALRFDRMLTLPVDQIKPSLQWALDVVASRGLKLDWVTLTNDLSVWERETTRLKWAEEFLKSSKEDHYAHRDSRHSESQPG